MSIIQRVESARAPLFVPATRPERFASADCSATDLVVIDLEDAVPPASKEAARAAAVEWLSEGHSAAVRINGIETEWFEDDMAALSSIGSAIALMVPKAEDSETLRELLRRLPPESTAIALIETASAVLDSSRIAATVGVSRLAFGSLDFAADIKVDPLDHEALLIARSMLVLASRAAGLPGPFDGVTTAIDNVEILRSDTQYARRIGLTGKLCIHPRQIADVFDVFAPTSAEIEWAKSVLRVARGVAVAVVDGKMVDAPVLARAEAILRQVETVRP